MDGPNTEVEQSRDHYHDYPVLRALHRLERKVDSLMATDQEVLDSVATLKTDLESVATAAQAEFAKLEAEVAAGNPASLDGIKAVVDSLDQTVKAVVVPTA